jgi:hypothetical protein
LQFAFGDQGLLAAVKFVQVGFDAGEQGGDFGLDFGLESGLGGDEVGFGDEFEVLRRISVVFLWSGRKDVFTLVVCRTFERRGKSDTPASKVLIEESSSARDSRRDETQPSNECAIL